MFIYNYHTHTSRCGHAYGSDEEYVKAAIEAGYKVLGFSDHAPYRDFIHDRRHMRWEQLPEYLSSISSLKEKYKDQIEIKIGLESEYYPFTLKERIELKQHLDYLLFGQHFSDPGEVSVSYFRENTEEEILGYGKAVEEGLRSGIFTYLCHPDVFMNRQPAFTKAGEEVAHRIGRACAETGTPVELNIRGVSKEKHPYDAGERYWYPHKEFWRILAQYPIKTVVGIDAHDPKDLLDTHFVEDGLKEVEDLDLHFIEEPFI